MKINNKEFVAKVLEVSAELEKAVDFTGMREKTVEAKKNEIFVQAVFEAVKAIGKNEKVVVDGFGTFGAKERKGRERKEERIIVMHKGTDKERVIVIPAGKSADKTILSFDSKVEY